jgi:hypothetical protein
MVTVLVFTVKRPGNDRDISRIWRRYIYFVFCIYSFSRWLILLLYLAAQGSSRVAYWAFFLG